MPAAAVASLTPAIAGMSGTSVGASGEMAVDMRASGERIKEALCITFVVKDGEGAASGSVVPAIGSALSRRPMTGSAGRRPQARVVRRGIGSVPDGGITRYGPRLKAGATTIVFLVTVWPAAPYFLAGGAILESLAASGFASGLASAFAAVSS